jgi:hypothetical protein
MKPWWDAACNLSNLYGLHDRPQSGEVDPPEPPSAAGQVHRRHRRGIRLLHRSGQALAPRLPEAGPGMATPPAAGTAAALAKNGYLGADLHMGCIEG